MTKKKTASEMKMIDSNLNPMMNILQYNMVSQENKRRAATAK
jgi:hypothetical protein